jgi:hypothetical protein
MKKTLTTPPLKRDEDSKATTFNRPELIANPYHLIMASEERDLFLEAERDHGLQMAIITENTRLDDLVTDGPVLFRVFAAFTNGPEGFDNDTLRAVFRKAEDVLFLGNTTTGRDYSRLIDAAVRGGSAVYVTIDDDHEVMWDNYLDRVWHDG